MAALAFDNRYRLTPTQEHTVMYPIDAIKVRKISRSALYGMDIADHGPDSDANPEPYPFSSLQWNDTWRVQNSHRRGHLKLMERHVQCDCWCRLVQLRKKDRETGANADMSRTRSCRLLCNL